MATFETIEFFKRYNKDLQGPCLEVGSLIMPGYTQYLPKQIHAGNEPEQYIGVDIFPGEGVDHVLDLCKNFNVDKLPVKKFKTIHCHYVMEHVVDIFSMARNIESMLEEGGVLLFSVPFSWRIHRIPVDMWRFTPQSIDYLFPNVEFVDERCGLHTRKNKKYYRLSDFPEFNLGEGLNKYPWYIKWYFKALRKAGLHQNIFNQRALLPETNIMMYGIKRDKPVYTYMDPQYI